MATLEDKSLWENQEADDEVEQEIRRLAPEEINNRTRLLENDIKVGIHTHRTRPSNSPLHYSLASRS